MNNHTVKSNIDDCIDELQRIENLITSLLGSTSPVVPYLNKYAIIKACGTIEKAFKDIISDICIKGASIQLQNFIEKSFRESSSNPNLDNIHKSLKNFDDNWNNNFKNNLNVHINKDKLKSSLKSLVQLRNTIAHGGNSSASIDDIIDYFNDSYEIMKILDKVVV